LAGRDQKVAGKEKASGGLAEVAQAQGHRPELHFTRLRKVHTSDLFSIRTSTCESNPPRDVQ
jgi:hypothetical protein